MPNAHENKFAKLTIAVPLTLKLSLKRLPEKRITEHIPVSCYREAMPMPTQAALRIFGSKNVSWYETLLPASFAFSDAFRALIRAGTSSF